MALNWSDELESLPLESLYLLEACHWQWLDTSCFQDEWCTVLAAQPGLGWVMCQKAPQLTPWVQRLLDSGEKQLTPGAQELERAKNTLLRSMEDWVIYLTNPQIYEDQPFMSWDPQELFGMADWAGKRVIDVGSGTGKQAFLAAPLCQSLYCVEPVENLRAYLKNKAKELGLENVFVTDGLVTQIPYENEFGDILTAGHVIGDDLEAEITEMLRVIKPGGKLILIPGNIDKDNDIHQFLVADSFEFSRFLEPGDGMKRKYWKIKPTGMPE